MNRELRRLQEKEERRTRQQRARAQARRAVAPQRERTGILQFLAEVVQELRRVAWPNRRELVTFTIVTLITSTVVTLYAFGLDVVFKKSVLFLVELA